jgi:2-methylisocitrate lyase-like PEP mutase family enzyme
VPPTQDQKAADSGLCTRGRPSSFRTPGMRSARVLAALGFKALASTSSGFAFTLGRPDGDATLDEVVEHARVLDQATSLPVSVDLENDGPRPEDAAQAVTRAADAGAVGGSIEDYDPEDGIYELDHAAERVAAVCEATTRPLNVLAHPGLSMSEIVDAGARRISVGGGLTWVAVRTMVAAGTEIREQGDLSSLSAPDPFDEWIGG